MMIQRGHDRSNQKHETDKEVTKLGGAGFYPVIVYPAQSADRVAAKLRGVRQNKSLNVTMPFI